MRSSCGREPGRSAWRSPDESDKNMFEKCPAGRPGTADEIGALAEFIMGPQGAFITGSDFLADGGATASYYYGPLQPGQA